MSAFATIVTHGTALELVAPSSPIPAGTPGPPPRFAGEPVRWIGVPAGTVVRAFATGSVTSVRTGPDKGIPGDAASGWSLYEFSPLPQMAHAAFKALKGGLPVQLVLLRGSGGGPPAQDDYLVGGETLATAPAGAGSTAFIGMAFQDRICRDPLSWAKEIAATGAADANWAQFVADIGAVAGARKLFVLDHVGRPMTGGGVSVSIDGGASTNVDFTNTSDGNTNIDVADGSRATVIYRTAANPIVASVGTNEGKFEAPLQLAAGARLAQVLDANEWLTQPTAGVMVRRWSANNNVETIMEGNPYFARLVDDLRAAMPGGAAELAGWCFVKGDQTDSNIPWPLIPGRDRAPNDTRLGPLIQELLAANVRVKVLVNQMLQFDSPVLDDFPWLGQLLLCLYTGLIPLQIFNLMATDPAGFVVGIIGVGLIAALTETELAEDLLVRRIEISRKMVDALNEISPDLAVWTPYPAAFADNPLVAKPFKLAGSTIDDFHRFGVYHQKIVNIKTASGAFISYVGGIDINSDRVDTSLHRAIHPFHDAQARITGPATIDIIRSFQERLQFHVPGATPPIDTIPATVPDAGSHLVQIARTYYKPAAAGSISPALPFAPNGEITPVKTIKAAFGLAREFIYIEDQYFSPPDDYVQALIDAASPSRGVKALLITCPYLSDQPYGGIRRTDVLKELSKAWTTRLSVGAPLRRFLHPTPALTTNLGRMRLAANMSATTSEATVGPVSHLPKPPFWAFIGSELVMVHATVGPVIIEPEIVKQTVQIVRAGGTPSWGAQPVEHPKDSPVTCVQIPAIYVHTKVTIVDDVFLYIGSTNVNRRGLYHDGEISSFTIPQHLKGDPNNPARILRARLMADHLGLPPEMATSLFADPISAIRYFQRSWYVGSKRQPLSFFGAFPPVVGLGTSDSIGGLALQVAIGALRESMQGELWTSLVDPTTELEEGMRRPGPEYT